MDIVQGSDIDRREWQTPVLTIGNFDGVHIGHREIIRRVLERASANGSESVALTFEPHPKAVLHHAEPPPRPEFQACNCYADRLNYLHVHTANWVRTFPDAPDPGMEALRQTLEVLLGLEIDGYVLVDFAGFVDLVEALGGVEVTVTESMDVAFSPAREGEDPVSVTVNKT